MLSVTTFRDTSHAPRWNPVVQSKSLNQPVRKKPNLPDWSGLTVACIGTGPSLSISDLELLRERRDIKSVAINNAGLRESLPFAAPWADILYAADDTWWAHFKPQTRALKVGARDPIPETDVTLQMLEREEPMPRTPGAVVSGGFGGFQALGMVLSMGAKRVLLLGYDCRKIDGKRNAMPREDRWQRDVDMGAWVQPFGKVNVYFPDREVINCSLESAITAFPKMMLQEALQCE